MRPAHLPTSPAALELRLVLHDVEYRRRTWWAGVASSPPLPLSGWPRAAEARRRRRVAARMPRRLCDRRVAGDAIAQGAACQLGTPRSSARQADWVLGRWRDRLTAGSVASRVRCSAPASSCSATFSTRRIRSPEQCGSRVVRDRALRIAVCAVWFSLFSLFAAPSRDGATGGRRVRAHWVGCVDRRVAQASCDIIRGPRAPVLRYKNRYDRGCERARVPRARRATTSPHPHPPPHRLPPAPRSSPHVGAGRGARAVPRRALQYL